MGEDERLYCVRCGADLGLASDPYRDPDCFDCLLRDLAEEAGREAEEIERRMREDG